MVGCCVGWEVGSGYQAPQFSGLASWVATALHGTRETQEKQTLGGKAVGKGQLGFGLGVLGLQDSQVNRSSIKLDSLKGSLACHIK